ncbi:MAG: MBL fold metallo-hydrolase [Nanoarchaeota archaeon]
MEVTWFGHASVRIVTKGGVAIYVDPYAGEDAWYDLPADVVLVTHGHYDHLKAALLRHIVVDGTVVMGTQAIGAQYHGAHPVWPGETHEVRGIRIRVIDAYNINKNYHPKGEGVGYVLEFDGTSLYIAGDTDFIPEMRKFRTDVVLLPIGGTYTMTAKEAAQVVLGMAPKVAIPIHWGSVVGTVDDAEMFKEIVDTAGQTAVHIMHANQTITL